MSRSLRIALLALGACAVAFLAWGLFWQDPDAGTGIERTPAREGGQADAGAGAEPGETAPRDEGPGAREERGAEGGAEGAPTASLVCRDAESGAPLEGVRLYDQKSKRELGVSAADGSIELREAPSSFLLLWGDGFFATPVDAGVSAMLVEGKAAHQKVWVDRYTMRRALRFSLEGAGALPERGAVHIRNLDASRFESEGFPTARIGEGRAVPKALALAWQVHVRHQLALPRRGVLLRAGTRSLPWRGELGGLALRFSEERRYEIRVYAQDGRVARAVVDVRARDDAPIELRFERGEELAVRVRGPDKRGLRGALVKLRFPERRSEAERRARSGEDGVARFPGLVLGDVVALTASARGYKGGSARGKVGDALAPIDLRAVAMRTHRLWVREMRSNRIVTGARLWLGDPSASSELARSSPEGIADLQLQEKEDVVLTVRAEGFAQHREIFPVRAGVSLPTTLYLVPEGRARQLELGLVARLAGRVLRDGRPQPGVRVTLTPARARDGRLANDAMKDATMVPIEQGGRARLILEGGRVRPALDASTDGEGRFVLWPSARGRASLQAYAEGFAKRDVIVVLGKRQSVELKGSHE